MSQRVYFLRSRRSATRATTPGFLRTTLRTPESLFKFRTFPLAAGIHHRLPRNRSGRPRPSCRKSRDLLRSETTPSSAVVLNPLISTSLLNQHSFIEKDINSCYTYTTSKINACKSAKKYFTPLSDSAPVPGLDSLHLSGVQTCDTDHTPCISENYLQIALCLTAAPMVFM